MLDALENQSVRMLGRGVLSGLELSDGGGFDLDVSDGYLNTTRTVAVAALSYTLPPSVTRWVWIDEDGAITLTASTTYPGGQVVCLGKVVTDGSGIDSISGDGRMKSLWWVDDWTLALGNSGVVIDVLNGRIGIGMVPTVPLESLAAFRGPGLELPEQGSDPAAEAAHVKVFAKAVEGKAELHIRHEDAGIVQVYSGAHLIDPVNVEAISATKELTIWDANIQRLDGGGSNRDVLLPAAADISFGHWFQIINVGGTNDLVIKTNGGGTTLGTLNPGERSAIIRPVDDSGVPAWPATTAVDSEEAAGPDV